MRAVLQAFPSPLGVISSLTLSRRTVQYVSSQFPSPLGVISSLTATIIGVTIIKCPVSVPSRGYLFLNEQLLWNEFEIDIGFRPLSGLSLP